MIDKNTELNNIKTLLDIIVSASSTGPFYGTLHYKVAES